MSFDPQEYWNFKIPRELPNGDLIVPPEGYRKYSKDNVVCVLDLSAKQAEHSYALRLHEYGNNPDGVIIDSIMGIEREDWEQGVYHWYDWVIYNTDTSNRATRDPSKKTVHDGDTWNIDYTLLEYDGDDWHFDADDAVYRVIIHTYEESR